MKYVTTVNNKRFEIEILADGSVMVDGQDLRHLVGERRGGGRRINLGRRPRLV